MCATSPPLAGFERTVGDEIQSLFGDAAGAVTAVRAVVREGGWHLGIGIGPIEGVPATVREGRGSAFVSAREAVDAAKSSGDVAVRAGGDAAVSPLMVSTIEVMCRFLAATIAGRTEAQIQAVRALDSGLTGRQAASWVSALRPSPSGGRLLDTTSKCAGGKCSKSSCPQSKAAAARPD